MSLKRELKELQKQKRAELHDLHDTYVATKREVKRRISPDRLVRKHMGVSLGAAAMLGMLFAPRPRAGGSGNGEQRGGGFFSGGIFGLLGGVFRVMLHLIGYFTGPSRQLNSPQPEGGQPPARKPTGLVQSLVESLLRRVDFNKLVADVVDGFGGKPKKSAPAGENGQPNAAPLRQEAAAVPDQSEEQ